MKTLTKLSGIAGVVLTLAGCNQNSSQIKSRELETIRGRPISVALEFSSLSTVIESNGKKILAYADCGSFAGSQAVALIQSEISDGDKENVELKGRYIGDKFNIENLKANGYEVDFN